MNVSMSRWVFLIAACVFVSGLCALPWTGPAVDVASSVSQAGPEPEWANTPASGWAVVCVVDTSSSMTQSRKIWYASRNIAYMTSIFSRENAYHYAKTKTVKFEWAVVTFGNCHSYLWQDFATWAGAETQTLREGLPASGDTPLVWGVTKALWFLYTHARAPRGKAMILSDGAEHCVERNASGQQAVMRLNARLRTLNLRKLPVGGEGGSLPRADNLGSFRHEFGASPDPDPVPLGAEDEKLEDAFRLLDQATQARATMPVQVDVIGLDIFNNPVAQEQLKSIATAGGGQYVEAHRPEELENAITRILPTEVTQPGGVPVPPAGGTQPVPGTQPQPISLDLVVCSDVVNGQPVGVADAFAQAAKVCAFWRFVDQAQGTVSTAIWRREGQEYARANQPVAGTGSATYTVTNSAAGGHPPGAYEIAIVINGATVANRFFRIGAAPPPQTPTTQPPTTQPTMPGGQAPPAGVIDAVLLADNGAEDFRQGVVLGFDGTTFWFSGEGGTIKIPRQKMYMLFIGDAETSIPDRITGGTIILKDGSLLNATLTRFDGRTFTVTINGQAQSLTRDQVLIICLRGLDA